jgi:amino acid transporter
MNYTMSNTSPIRAGGEQPSDKKLSTFAGVFTPSILTILGIILFLRLGYVTGSGGVATALVIVGLANVITVLTTQSLAAIATNLKVKGGGDYYLISRTLGVEFGGGIGLVLYLAQSVSVGFYCIGFAEAVSSIFNLGGFFSPQIVALLATGFIFILAWLGADWATRFQYVVMALLAAALLSFFLGGIPQWRLELFAANWAPPESPAPFWVIFAIFFPAVTGFTQGVSMSGDLKDPGKSLPTGTFMAVFLSIIIYLGVVVVFGGTVANDILVSDFQAIKQVSRYDFLIDAGVIAATLSSAMASFLGGPRILQSLSRDQIFPLLNPFEKGHGPHHNPRRAILLTGAIAVGIILAGQLNLVARVVSMFFLISYGLLNYATWYEAHTESPSFRPRFKWFNKYLSLLGCLICLGIIFAIDLKYGLTAMATLFAIHQYIRRKDISARWADSSRSHSMQVIRKEILGTYGEPEHDRDWRPHILVFTKDRDRRRLLLYFSGWIGGSTGLISAVTILTGDERETLKKRSIATRELYESIEETSFKIFPLVVHGPDIPTTLKILLQGYGVGPLKGNTFLCNWYGESMTTFPGLETMKFGHNLRLAYRAGYNLVVFHGDPHRTEHFFDGEKKKRTIDVWWSDNSSSRLMLLFAYLMTRNPLWRSATLRLLSIADNLRLEEDLAELELLLDEARIEAVPTVVPDILPETVIRFSAGSDLVFLPFKISRSMLTDIHGYSLERVLTRLPPTALVMAAKDIELAAEPEDGMAGRLAEALDRVQELEKRLARAAAAQDKDDKLCAELLKALEEASSHNGDDAAELAKQLEAARQRAEKSFRKTAKERARLDDARKTVKQLYTEANT